jgi:hypothetical protein
MQGGGAKAVWVNLDHSYLSPTVSYATHQLPNHMLRPV